MHSAAAGSCPSGIAARVGPRGQAPPASRAPCHRARADPPAAPATHSPHWAALVGGATASAAAGGSAQRRVCPLVAAKPGLRWPMRQGLLRRNPSPAAPAARPTGCCHPAALPCMAIPAVSTGGEAARGLVAAAARRRRVASRRRVPAAGLPGFRRCPRHTPLAALSPVIAGSASKSCRPGSQRMAAPSWPSLGAESAVAPALVRCFCVPPPPPYNVAAPPHLNHRAAGVPQPSSRRRGLQPPRRPPAPTPARLPRHGAAGGCAAVGAGRPERARPEVPQRN